MVNPDVCIGGVWLEAGHKRGLHNTTQPFFDLSRMFKRMQDILEVLNPKVALVLPDCLVLGVGWRSYLSRRFKQIPREEASTIGCSLVRLKIGLRCAGKST